MKSLQFGIIILGMLVWMACGGENTGSTNSTVSGGGPKVAFVYGDTILHQYSEFRKASDQLSEKQRDAEEQLQAKGADLQKEIMAYQQKVQQGILSRNEMETQERRLGAKQDALMQERDQMSNALMTETAAINDRLMKVIKDKLAEIKAQEGYDFIFNYGEGGTILLADDKYDITQRVLKALNNDKSSTPADTSKAN